MAEAAGIQFESCANVYEFYHTREQLFSADNAGKSRLLKRMRRLALDDIALAKKMRPLLKIDSSIGYQAEMRCYSFSENLIDAKIAQVNEMLDRLRHLMAE